MKVVGLLCARNEQWIIRPCLAAALKWCEEVVVVDNGSVDLTDKYTGEFSGKYPYRVRYSYWPATEEWDEMPMRQHSLDLGRRFNGTHFALIDADEILTANLWPKMRDWLKMLEPGQMLDMPMLAMRDLDRYQADDTVWSRSVITVGFMDKPDAGFKPGPDGYQHHHRYPRGCEGKLTAFRDKAEGGVMHLQFANVRRMVAKHVLYRMVDHMRWPNRESVEALNRKYDSALKAPNAVTDADPAWWAGYPKDLIDLKDDIPWHEGEIRRLIQKHGREMFSGLDLKGF